MLLSYVHTFQTRISRSFPCLLLIHCLVFAGICYRCQVADTETVYQRRTE
jgi:hypothetical protein